MARTALTRSSLATARILAGVINNRLGYPSAGTNVGGGIHVGVLEGTTLRHSRCRKHPTLALWAWIVDATTDGVLTAGERAGVVTLDATWDNDSDDPTAE